MIFWDVDTQHDSVRANGELFVPNFEAICRPEAPLTDYAHAKHIRIIASADDHVPGHRSCPPPTSRNVPSTACAAPRARRRSPDGAAQSAGDQARPEGRPRRRPRPRHRGDILQ